MGQWCNHMQFFFSRKCSAVLDQYGSCIMKLYLNHGKSVLVVDKWPSTGPITIIRAGTAGIVRNIVGTGPVVQCLLGRYWLCTTKPYLYEAKNILVLENGPVAVIPRAFKPFIKWNLIRIMQAFSLV